MDKLCVQIVEAGLVSAGLPCSWLEVVIRCRVTRQLVVVGIEKLLIKGLQYQSDALIIRR